MILKLALVDFLKILPILVIAIVASEMVDFYVRHRNIKKHFKENERNIVKASFIGISVPGPILAFLPLLKTLKKKGVPLSIIVAFMIGQTLVGPARVFLELDYFGFTFFAYRLVISFAIAVGIATCFMFLERYVEFL